MIFAATIGPPAVAKQSRWGPGEPVASPATVAQLDRRRDREMATALANKRRCTLEAMKTGLEYRTDRALSADEFIDVLERSTLGERRPVADRGCMEGMVKNANLMVTAWDGATLVGVARSVTDFCYACYLSDLAVDVSYQRSGIGRALVSHTLKQLGPRCKIRLISAPAAMDYYAKLGFVQNTKCWELGHAK